MRFDKFVDSLYVAGWRAPCDAQHSEVRKLHAQLFPVVVDLEEDLDAAQARIRELEAQLEESHLQEISTVGQLQTALEQRDKARNRERLIADNLRFERELHDAARREAAEVQACAKWQPIETAPKDGTNVLVWWEGGPGYDNPGAHVCSYLDNSKTTRPWAGFSLPSGVAISPGAKPTHWKSLSHTPYDETPALQSAIEQAVAEERETIIAKLLEIGALGDGDYIAMIRARSLA